MQEYYFSKRIFCGLCGNSMRGICERNVKKYVCSSYSSNSNNCIRNKIEEQVLINHVLQYTNLKNIRCELSKKYFRDIIEEVKIFEDNNFIIKYKDGSEGHIKNNGIRYV